MPKQVQKVARRPFACHVCSPVQKCLRFYYVILLWIIVVCFALFLETVPYMMFKFVFNRFSFPHFIADFKNRQFFFYLKIKCQNPQKIISFQLFNTFNLFFFTGCCF